MRYLDTQRADILETASKHGAKAAAEQYDVSINTIKSWQRRHGQHRVVQRRDAVAKIGAADDVTPTQLRRLAGRLAVKLDTYLDEGGTLKIGPLARAVADLLRAVRELAALPSPAMECGDAGGEPTVTVLRRVLADLGMADTPGVQLTLRHRLLEAAGNTSPYQLAALARDSAHVRSEEHRERLTRAMAVIEKVDRRQRPGRLDGESVEEYWTRPRAEDVPDRVLPVSDVDPLHTSAN